MEGDPKFTLYWRTGAREIVQGRTIEEAMMLAGYSGGAVRALDFYAKGENDAYRWDQMTREWCPREADLAAPNGHEIGRCNPTGTGKGA